MVLCPEREPGFGLTQFQGQALGPKVLVVSNVASFRGGGAIGFRDVILALRKKRPDLDLIALYPWKGSLARECNQYGARTKVGLISWWAFIQRWRTPHFEALFSAIFCWLLLVLGVGHALVTLVRLRRATVVGQGLLGNTNRAHRFTEDRIQPE